MPFSNGENLWIVPPNKATIIDNKVYGRGACDMKGGIASALAAIFRCIKEDNGCGKIIVNLVSDEENTSLYGTVQLCNNELLNADFAIVMEPTECKVCPQQLGNMFFQTYIRGIGGHTGVPKNKVNPFELAFQYVEKLKEWINTKKQNVEDIQPFINIGHFQGGTASGTIPSECELFGALEFYLKIILMIMFWKLMKLLKNFKIAYLMIVVLKLNFLKVEELIVLVLDQFMQIS